MKNSFFLAILFLCMVNFANAAFVVKRTVAVPLANTESVHNQEKAVHESFFGRVKNKVYSKLMSLDEHYGRGGGEGSRAFFWGLIGIFLWPLGILAIIHGVHGLNSRNGLEQDKAVLGLIMGILEVLACVGFVFWFIGF